MRQIVDEAAPQRDDAGLSLIELMVTMAVMSVVMLVFTTGIIQVYWANRRVETQSVAQSQLHRAFQRFDRELRYASSISLPGKVGGRWYVEFAEADPTRCVRLRLDPNAQPHGSDGAGILQLIRWKLGTTPAATASWTTVASNIDPGPDPFEKQDVGALPYAGAVAGQDFRTAFQRLRIHLKAKVGGTVTEVDTTFTAVNSAKATQIHACEKDWLRA